MYDGSFGGLLGMGTTERLGRNSNRPFVRKVRRSQNSQRLKGQVGKIARTSFSSLLRSPASFSLASKALSSHAYFSCRLSRFSMTFTGSRTCQSDSLVVAIETLRYFPALRAGVAFFLPA